jgi:hypothetical protein
MPIDTIIVTTIDTDYTPPNDTTVVRVADYTGDDDTDMTTVQGT